MFGPISLMVEGRYFPIVSFFASDWKCNVVVQTLHIPSLSEKFALKTLIRVKFVWHPKTTYEILIVTAFIIVAS